MNNIFYFTIIGLPIGMLLCIFSLIRNDWVFEKFKEVSDSIYKKNISLIPLRVEKNMIFPYTGPYDEFLESYNKIFFCFWKWKIKHFFKTKEAYEYFYG